MDKILYDFNMQRYFWVYLMCNRKQGTLYCGHTDDISRRILAHREGRGSTYTRKFKIKRLVWYEPQDTREAAKWREYRIKNWKRGWKITSIEKDNPDWDDLYYQLNM